MSQNTWIDSLTQFLRTDPKWKGDFPRIAIVGIGNDSRNDDAAGALVAQALLRRDYSSHLQHVLVLEASQAPENMTGELRTFDPDLVLLVDAAEMDAEPGAIHFISMDEIDGISASTHSLPLSMLARYLTLEFGCKVALLGIQPANIDYGNVVCEEVTQATIAVIDGIWMSIFETVSE